MTTLVFIIMILSGITFIVSVLLMTPKWGLWFGIGGMSTSNEYGSKKSIESTLKKSALFSVVIASLSAIIYPYLAKDKLTVNWNQQQIKLTDEQNKQLQQKVWESIKIEWKDVNWENTKTNFLDQKENFDNIDNTNNKAE